VDYIPSIGQNWFLDPNGDVDDEAPSITGIVPADDAVGVALGASVVWTFDKALALSTVTLGNFLLIEDVTGDYVPGALSINAVRKQVTFTPSANLTAGTAYRAIVTQKVKSVYGIAL